MNFVRSRQPQRVARTYAFHITEREKAMLLATLKMFPMLDASHHRLSANRKSTGKAEQEWLEEAMEQQRKDHKKRLAQLFKDDGLFFKEQEDDLRLILNSEQMEWMLRVLNEIRVGSWVRLGRPEMEVARLLAPNSVQGRYLAAMDLSGYFESALLEAFA